MNKKTMIISSILLFIILVSGLSIFLIKKDAMLIRNPIIVQQNASITYALGECLYKESSNSDWLPIELGQKIKVGYSLKTLDDGEIDIKFSQNTLMKMDNNCVLHITDNTLKNLSVNLNKGKLFAKFHKLFTDQEFNVLSGNTVAGIRGTDLVFEAFTDKTDVYALSGITEIYNTNYNDDKILLAFQKQTTVKADSAPTQPVDMDPDTVLEYQQILNLIHSEKVFLISNNINFKANTPEIQPTSYDELSTIVEAMKSKSFKIEIAGHTADVGSSSAMYDLSLLRAQAIKNYLIEQGVSEKRLEVKGYGGSKPIADNETPEGKAKNRRVEFIILEN